MHLKRLLILLVLGSVVAIQFRTVAAGAENGADAGSSAATTKAATSGDSNSAADERPEAAALVAAPPAARLNVNVLWLLLTGFLVIAMQAGFAMVETGARLVRRTSLTR